MSHAALMVSVSGIRGINGDRPGPKTVVEFPSANVHFIDRLGLAMQQRVYSTSESKLYHILHGISTRPQRKSMGSVFFTGHQNKGQYWRFAGFE